MNNIDKIRTKLKELMKFSETMKFKDVPLEDGTKLIIDDAAEVGVGVDIYQVDDQGNQIVAADNTYKLSDGRTITVKGGKIESITDVEKDQEDKNNETPVEDATKAEMEELPVEETPTEEGDLEYKIKMLEEELEEIKEMLAQIVNSQEVAMSKINDLNKPEEIETKLNKDGFNPKRAFDADIKRLRELQKGMNFNKEMSSISDKVEPKNKDISKLKDLQKSMKFKK